MKLNTRSEYRQRRHRRVRRKIRGTAARPRLSVIVSSRHMSVQFIDDDKGVTLASASTIGKQGRLNVALARDLGKTAGTSAKEKGISLVVVDRGGHRFHGRVKALVDAAVEAGLSISDKPVGSPEEGV